MRKYIIYFSLLLFTFFQSCKKGFLDINQNPNTVTESKITADLILPNAINGTGTLAYKDLSWLANWIGYWSPSGSYAPNTEESTYNITTSFHQGFRWTAFYDVLFDLENAEEKAKTAGQPYYQAMSMILKAQLFQTLVDTYGNVPYSEAFKASIATPKYDKAQDIYNNLQVKLDSGILLIKNITVPSSSPIANVDIIYHGDAAKWVRLANTIKLRLLIRQSEISGFSPAAELTKIQATGGVLQSGESASANLAYTNDVGKQSPYYGDFGFDPSGNNANEVERANNYALGILKSTTDPRLGYFFRPAVAPLNPADPYIGTTYGDPPNNTFEGTKTSNIGAGLAFAYNQPQWIVTSIEALFLKAEAVARGWLPGNAQLVYEEAVRESFIWLKIPNATSTANNYLSTVPIANWANAGTSIESRIKFILNQKYIALIGINPMEAWNDYRRLGVPSNLPISTNPARVGNTIPVRLLYTAIEQAVNGTNVSEQGSINPFTSKIFWDFQ